MEVIKGIMNQNEEIVLINKDIQVVDVNGETFEGKFTKVTAKELQLHEKGEIHAIAFSMDMLVSVDEVSEDSGDNVSASMFADEDDYDDE